MIKKFTNKSIAELDRIYRLNLINSLSGYKAANLIGTKGSIGENLAIISSVVHLGADPPLLGFVMRPARVERHTLSNLLETKMYTINHVSKDLVERAHYTSAHFPAGTSEFEKCKIEAEYISEFDAPFVKESCVKMGMRLVETLPIKANDTLFIVGEIEYLLIEDSSITENGQVDLNQLQTVCISGLNRYHEVTELANHPYARVDELPEF